MIDTISETNLKLALANLRVAIKTLRRARDTLSEAQMIKGTDIAHARLEAATSQLKEINQTLVKARDRSQVKVERKPILRLVQTEDEVGC